MLSSEDKNVRSMVKGPNVTYTRNNISDMKKTSKLHHHHVHHHEIFCEMKIWMDGDGMIG